MAQENGTPAAAAKPLAANLEAERADRAEAILAMLASSSVGRARFAQRAGLQYGSNRDVYKVAGYVAEGGETFEHYRSLYERDAVAGRIVDLPASTTWKTPPEILEPGFEEAPTAFMQNVDDLVKKLRLWSRFERVDRLSRIGRYGVLLIGVPGVDADLSNEMPRLNGIKDVLFLSAFHEGSTKIKSWDKNTDSPRFGLPMLYEIDLSGGVEGFPAVKAEIHHSRIIHVAEDLLDDEVHGRPALKRALNPLFDLQKIAASTGEGFWQVAVRTLVGKFEGEITPEQLVALGEDLEAITHDLRRHFLSRGAELEWLSTTPPDPSNASGLYMEMLSAASGIPKRILLGSERGELASSQDERNFFGMVNERQENHAEPNILRALLDRLIQYGGLTPPGEEGYEIVWPELFEMSEKEKAEANKLRAETAKHLTPVGGSPMDLVEITDDRDVWLKSTSTLEEDGFFEEEEVPEPQPVPPGLGPNDDPAAPPAGADDSDMFEGEDD